jgi:hypothetical protein
LQTETGGFGGLLLTTHEWTGSDKIKKSLDLFARYVIPHFRGHTRGYHREWDRLQQAAAKGGVKLDGPGKPSNLTVRDEADIAPGNNIKLSKA